MTRIQVELADEWRLRVPTEPAGPGTERAELSDQPLSIEVDARAIRGTYRAQIEREGVVEALTEDLSPWVRGDVSLTWDIADNGETMRLTLALDRRNLVQLVEREGPLVRLSQLAPVGAALGRHRRALGSVVPQAFLPAQIRIRIEAAPYACTFEDNRDASVWADVLHGCPEINGNEVCGEPMVHGIRFDSDAIAGISTCLSEL